MAETKILNIYEKMLKATEQIGNVQKNLEVGVGKNQYKAVGEADVLKAVKPIEVEVGIYSYPLSRKVIDTNIFTTSNEYQGKVTERNNLFMRIETVYRFVNTEKPEEFIDITTYGDGVDTQDKAPGKAMTYSDKYALLKAYKIGTGDDPDQNASQDGKFGKTEEQKLEEEMQAIAKKKIDKVQIAAVQAELARTGIKEKLILGKYKLDSLESMKFIQWQDCMRNFEVTATKVQKDLGL